MQYVTIGHRLPHALSAPLFGDRKRWGCQIDYNDPIWQEWEKTYLHFYTTTQKSGIGDHVNHAGYQVMRHIDLTGKRVLEIGPGDISHIAYWHGMPQEYVIADIQQIMLERSSAILKTHDIPHAAVRLQRDHDRLPFDSGRFDVVISFYSLEHIESLAALLTEIQRILGTGGMLIGAIPAEGGLAWGIGRLITSRRWLKANTGIDPDKLICWEHLNFADHILQALDRHFSRIKLSFWPFPVPLLDPNLVVRFIYAKA